MQSQESPSIEAGKARSFGFDRCTDRLQTHEQALPGIGHASRVRRYERQPRAAGECLSETHIGVDAKRLSSQRDLPDDLCAMLGREGNGRLQQLSSIPGCHRELEAG